MGWAHDIDAVSMLAMTINKRHRLSCTVTYQVVNSRANFLARDNILTAGDVGYQLIWQIKQLFIFEVSALLSRPSKQLFSHFQRWRSAAQRVRQRFRLRQKLFGIELRAELFALIESRVVAAV